MWNSKSGLMVNNMSTMRTSRKPSMAENLLRLIDVLAGAERPLRVAEIAKRLGVARTSVYRLVSPLEAGGYVRRLNPTRGYVLSLRFLELAEVVREGLEVRRIAYPAMERLRDEVQLAVHLVLRDGDEAVYMEKVESKRPVRLYTRIGRRVPLHVAACPRVLLAYCPDEEVAAYLSRAAMLRYTPATVTDPAAIWELVKQVRASGYSTSYGELEPDTGAVAVPVHNDRGEVVASLSLAGPEWQFKVEDLNHLVSRLRATSDEISKELGFRGKRGSR